MNSFLDFLNKDETNIILEAYTPIINKKFNSKQLKEIGDFLSSNNSIGVQGSDVQHWKAKDFRFKMAVPNSIAICKLKDGDYVILKVYSQQTVSIIKNTSSKIYNDAKTVIKDSTDIFTFNSVDIVKDIRNKRYELNKNNDPLLNKHSLLQKNINNYKNNVKDYVKELNKKLLNTGITIEDLYFKEYNGIKRLFFDVDVNYSKFKYVTTDLNTFNDKIKYEFRTKGVTFKSEQDFVECINEVKRAQETFKLFNNIDYSKIKVVNDD